MNLFLSYNQQFIDNLQGKYDEESINILYDFKFTDKEMKDIVDEVFGEIIAIIKKEEEEYNIENIKKIKEALKNNIEIFDLLKNKLEKEIDKDQIIFNIMSEYIKEVAYYEFLEVFKKKLHDNRVDILKNIINYLGDELSLYSILFSKQEEKKKIDNFKEILDSYKLDLKNKNNYSGLKNIFLEFNLPCFYKSIRELNIFIKEDMDKDKNKLEENFVERIFADKKINDILCGKDKKEISFLYEYLLLYYIFIKIKVRVKKKDATSLIIKLLDKIIHLYLYINNNNIIIMDEVNIDTSNLIEQILKKENVDKNKLIKIFSKILFFLEYNIKLISKIILLFFDIIDIIPDFIKNFIIEAKKNINNYITDNKFIEDSFYSFCLYFFQSTLKLKEGKEQNLFDEKNENILYDESIEKKYNEIVNNNNKYLIEILIYYFEIYNENKYFKKGREEVLSYNNYAEISEILGTYSKDSLNNLNRVSFAYDYYENKFNKEKNLKLLYMIRYLKIYMKYYAKIIYIIKNQSKYFNLDLIKYKLNLKSDTWGLGNKIR